MKRTVVPAVALLAFGVAGCTQAQVVHTGSAARPVPHRTGAPAHRAAEPVRRTPTARPVTHDGACPYLATDFVMQTVGQHLARTTVTTVTTAVPASCAFYRPDGALAAKVDGAQFASAAEAAAKVRSVTGAGANGVSDVGDGGAVAITNDGAVLAASRGDTVLVITINQQSSLEATELAQQAFAHL